MDWSNGSTDTGRSSVQTLRLTYSNKSNWAAVAHCKSNLLGKVFNSKPSGCKTETLIFALVRTRNRMEIDLGYTGTVHLTSRDLSMKRAEKMSPSQYPEITPSGELSSLLCSKCLRERERET